MNPKWRVFARPAGDYAVQRFIGGRTVRWGVYATKAEAEDMAKAANALCP